MIEEIEDEYREYLDDERGYAWDAWDVLPRDVVRRHDALLASGPEAIAEVDPGGLDDLDRWAYARACRQHGDATGFLDAARLILTSNSDHRGIDYADVFVTTIESLARAEAIDEARLQLTTFQEKWPDDSRGQRLEVYVALRWDFDEALASANELFATFGDDPEFLFEVVEDIADAGHRADALELAERLRTLAEEHDARALLVDIELLVDRLGDAGTGVTA